MSEILKGETMKTRFDWRAAYFHLVSLVAMIVILISVINLGHGVLQLAFPTLSMNQYDWEQVESFQAYKDARGARRAVVDPDAQPKRPDTPAEVSQGQESDQQLRTAWQERRTVMVEGQRRRGLWMLVEAIVTALIVYPIFWWHRRQAKLIKDTEIVGN
jgi:hypothetical protein